MAVRECGNNSNNHNHNNNKNDKARTSRKQKTTTYSNLREQTDRVGRNPRSLGSYPTIGSGAISENTLTYLGGHTGTRSLVEEVI